MHRQGDANARFVPQDQVAAALTHHLEAVPAKHSRGAFCGHARQLRQTLTSTVVRLTEVDIGMTSPRSARSSR